MSQLSLFETATYDELVVRNAAKVQTTVERLKRSGLSAAESELSLGLLGATTRLEILLSILKGLRVLPPEFEYLYEMQIDKELNAL